MRIRTTLLIVGLIIFHFSCKNSGVDEKNIQMFNMNFSGGSLESTDPAFAKDLFSMWTVHMLYNTLVEADSNLDIQPSIAKNWLISNDGLTYTFNLNKNIYFHDHAAFKGNRKVLNANDVVYSFRRIVNPSTSSTGSWIFNEHIKDSNAFTALNDSTFQLKLIRPFAPMLSMLSMPYCSIVPKEVVEYYGKDFRNNPCGTGPFSFKKWDEGNLMLLHKNKSYWEYDTNGNQLPKLDIVTIKFHESKATEFLLFLQKKIDFTHGIDGSFKDLVLKKNGQLQEEYSKKFKLTKKNYLNTEYLGFLLDTNVKAVQSSPLKHLKVRQAINYAIDREQLIRYFKNGIGTPAHGGFCPPGFSGFTIVTNYGYRYNPTLSKKLLVEAGFPNGKGLSPITIYCPENFVDIVNYICTQLADVGIPAKLEVIQPNILKQQMSQSEVMCFRAQWIGDYPDAETYLSVFLSTNPAPPNYTRFHSATFDQLYREAMLLPDSLRFKTYRKLDSIAIQQAPIIPLFYDEILHFTQNNIEGFSSNPMNLIDLKNVVKH
jgi:oligopeptide transport system substrate-binding protein